MNMTINDKAARIEVVDIARGMAVLIMMLVHTLWMYGSPSVQSESLLGHVIHTLGKGTPVFLLCMGISLTFSRHTNPKGLLLRGVIVLLLGYWMNLLKFIVPISVLGTMPEDFIAAYQWQSPLTSAQLLYLVLTGDILQLAGMSLLVLALIWPLLKNPWWALWLAALVLFTSRELSALALDIPGLTYLSHLFFSDDYRVYFPVFPWFAYILLGVFLGERIRRFGAGRVFDSLLWPGLVVAGVGFFLCWWHPAYHYHNFFHHGPGAGLALVGINLVLLWFTSQVVTRGFWSPISKLSHYMSRRVTSIYIIQWVVVCWGMGIVGYQQLNAWQTLAMMPVVVLATFLLQGIKDHIPLPVRRAKPVTT